MRASPLAATEGMHPDMGAVQRIHFVGIGGAGMCGIAEVLQNHGFAISGSDISHSLVTDRLAEMGAKIHIGHHASHVEGADVVVTSSAIDGGNPEVDQALALRIPVVRRAEMLGELMRYRYGIAVAGTHGKTTTTSMIASVFAEAELDPTFIIGGLLKQAQSNGRLGEGAYLIAEADESDASFLHLLPHVAVLTNVDRDHLTYYDGSFDKLQRAFVEFVHNLPFYGYVVACRDDPIVRALLPRINRRVVTYGFDKEADVRGTNIRHEESQSAFDVEVGSNVVLSAVLDMPGAFNVQNALAAVAVAIEEGIGPTKIRHGLSSFSGVGRRFERIGRFRCPSAPGEFLLVDDYGHHPSEVRVTIEAIRVGWPNRRLLMIYQPHRYTRTLELFDQFVEVLSRVDLLILLDVYPAGEKRIEGATGLDLARSITLRSDVEVIFVADVAKVPAILEAEIADNDLVLTQGAGETSHLAAALKTRWQKAEVYS